MFCNPNACFYEYLAYQTEWLNYYTTELGLNMIIFNYRGYGRSDMSSSNMFMQRNFKMINPEHMMKDAAVVLEYAKEKFIQLPENYDNVITSPKINVKVIIHGESLGGMAASFVAMKDKKLPVDFVFINRTFSSLDSVAFWGAGISTMLSNILNHSIPTSSFCYMKRRTYAKIIGKIVTKVFGIVTQWNDSNLKNYLGIEKSLAKYVLYGCDPVNDNIVNDLSSLKSANTRHLIYESMNVPFE